MKSRKWYRRRHKAEWRREQLYLQYPYLRDMEKTKTAIDESFARFVEAFSEQVWKPMTIALNQMYYAQQRIYQESLEYPREQTTDNA